MANVNIKKLMGWIAAVVGALTLLHLNPISLDSTIGGVYMMVVAYFLIQTAKNG